MLALRRLISLFTALGLMVPAVAIAKGGSGVITSYRVGTLTMNQSTDADIRAFAGTPDSVTTCGARCVINGPQYDAH